MTVNEMIDAWYIYYDKIAKLTAPGYKTEEVLLFLNNGQDKFITERLFGDGTQSPVFDYNQKRVADIRPLVKSYDINSSNFSIVQYYPNTRRCSMEGLIDDFQYLLDFNIVVSRTRPTIVNKRVVADYTRKELIKNFVDSGNNKTHFLNPKIWIDQNLLYLMVDSYTTSIGTSYIVYTKIPNALEADGECELEVQVHQEIVEKAVWDAVISQGDRRVEALIANEKLNPS